MTGACKSLPKISISMSMVYTTIVYVALFLSIISNVRSKPPKYIHKAYGVLRSPVIVPANTTTNQTAIILFIHGINQTGWHWSINLKKVREPYMSIICPRGNDFYLKYKGGKKKDRAWFNQYNKTVFDRRGNPRNCSKIDLRGIQKMTAYIKAIIEDLVKNKGAASKNIIVGGFDQGGVLAMNVALTFWQKLGGLIIYGSETMIPHNFKDFIHPENENIPILHIHDKGDEDVPFELGESLSHYLRNISRNYQFKTYNDGVHWITDEALHEIGSFIKNYTWEEK